MTIRLQSNNERGSGCLEMEFILPSFWNNCSHIRTYHSKVKTQNALKLITTRLDDNKTPMFYLTEVYSQPLFS